MGEIAVNPNESEQGAIPTSTESADLSLQKEEAPAGRLRSLGNGAVNRTRKGYVPRADMCRETFSRRKAR